MGSFRIGLEARRHGVEMKEQARLGPMVMLWFYDFPWFSSGFSMGFAWFSFMYIYIYI